MVGAVQAIGAALVLVISPAVALSGSPPVQSRADSSLSPRQGQVTVLAEIHGTNEIPALFLDTVRRTARRGRVVVGLEMPPEAAAISCGTATPRHLTPYWTNSLKSGLTSGAMRRMICELQMMERSRRITLVYLDNVGRVQDYDTLAVERFQRAFARQPAAGLILTGSYHARNIPGTTATRLRSLGVNVRTVVVSSPGGTAWVCYRLDACQVNETHVQYCSAAGSAGGRTIPLSDPELPWDACLPVPVPALTASPPATP